MAFEIKLIPIDLQSEEIKKYTETDQTAIAKFISALMHHLGTVRSKYNNLEDIESDLDKISKENSEFNEEEGFNYDLWLNRIFESYTKKIYKSAQVDEGGDITKLPIVIKSLDIILRGDWTEHELQEGRTNILAEPLKLAEVYPVNLTKSTGTC